jgi:hypothetical protein
MRTWFHAVVYCLSAKGARLEPYEVGVCQRLVGAGHCVLIALTKVDAASGAELAAMRAELADKLPGLVVVETSSTTKTLRTGKLVEPSGLEPLLAALTANVEENMRRKLDRKTAQQMENYLSRWRHEVLEEYDRHAGLFSSTSATLRKVSDKAADLYGNCWQRLIAWRERLSEQHAALHGASHSAFSRKAEVAAFSSGKLALDGDRITWEGVDSFTSAVMMSIPGLNLVYLFTSTSMHRGILEEKLIQFSSEAVRTLQGHLAITYSSASPPLH